MTEEQKSDNAAAEGVSASAADAAPADKAAVEAAPLKGIVGTKIGMTRIFTSDTVMVPVTVISAQGVVVTQVKTRETDGYTAVQVGYEEVAERKLSKAEAQHLMKKGLAPKRHLTEFRVADAAPFKVGQPVPVSVFSKGEWINVSGVSKGKGFAGTIKRHNFSGLPHSHGNGEYRRHPGTSGAQGPQHVLPGTRKPGHMGHVWSTIQKVEVVDVDPQENLILLRGSIPGPNGNFVVLSPSSRKVAAKAPEPAKKKAKK